MPNSEINLDIQKIAWIILNTFRYMAIAGFVYFLMGLSISIKKNYPLWVSPLHAEGTIVDYEDKSWQSLTNGSYITTSTKLPVVEFQDTANITIKFTDNIGHNSTSYKNKVPVIYSKEKPSNAKVDKGLLFNWVDTYIWLFGTIGCLLGIVRFSKANVASMLKKLDNKNA